MGGAVAKPSGLTREKLLQSTANSRDFTNKLFQVMISKLTPEDFLKLARPQTCGTFVFMMAESIGNLFQSLRIRPRRDRDSGVVYFEKADTLRTQSPQTRELCLIIAYYYIRIFQTFGALAITILDDPGAGQVLGAIRYAPQEVPQQRVGFFGKKPVQPIPGRRVATLSGGVVILPQVAIYFRAFEPFRVLFSEPISVIGSSLMQYPFVEFPNMSLIPGRRDGTKSQNLLIELSSGTKIYGNMSVFQQKTTTIAIKYYTFKFDNFKYDDSSLDKMLLAKINTKLRAVHFEFNVKSTDGGATWELTRTGKSIAEALNSIITRVETDVTKLLENPEGQLDKRYGQREGEQVATGIAQGRDVGVQKQLQNDYLIQTLKSMAGQKTVGFCVARALQLLDANVMYQPRPQSAKSSVCTARFDAIPVAVPQSGQTLDKVTGLRALDQLFYTQPSISTKEEVQLQIADPTEYAQFLQTMTDVFGRSGAQAKPTSIDKILAKDPNCPSNAIKHYLQIQDPKAVQAVLKIVQELFAKQMAHTQRVIKFFRERMFLIHKVQDKALGRVVESVELHPRIVQGGVDAVSALSRDARTILVEYYKGCEETYQRGVQIVLGSKYSVV
jgi:hypothetical protein